MPSANGTPDGSAMPPLSAHCSERQYPAVTTTRAASDAPPPPQHENLRVHSTPGTASGISPHSPAVATTTSASVPDGPTTSRMTADDRGHSMSASPPPTETASFVRKPLGFGATQAPYHSGFFTASANAEKIAAAATMAKRAGSDPSPTPEAPPTPAAPPSAPPRAPSRALEAPTRNSHREHSSPSPAALAPSPPAPPAPRSSAPPGARPDKLPFSPVGSPGASPAGLRPPPDTNGVHSVHTPSGSEMSAPSPMSAHGAPLPGPQQPPPMAQDGAMDSPSSAGPGPMVIDLTSTTPNPGGPHSASSSGSPSSDTPMANPSPAGGERERDGRGGKKSKAARQRYNDRFSDHTGKFRLAGYVNDVEASAGALGPPNPDDALGPGQGGFYVHDLGTLRQPPIQPSNVPPPAPEHAQRPQQVVGSGRSAYEGRVVSGGRERHPRESPPRNYAQSPYSVNPQGQGPPPTPSHGRRGSYHPGEAYEQHYDWSVHGGGPPSAHRAHPAYSHPAYADPPPGPQRMPSGPFQYAPPASQPRHESSSGGGGGGPSASGGGFGASAPGATGAPPGARTRVVNVLIKDLRSPDLDDQYAEIRVPLGPAGEGEDGASQGYWADAKAVADALQAGPGRIDGPAKVYTMRGKYRQYFLRITEQNVDQCVNANLLVSPKRVLDITVEPTGPRPPSSVASSATAIATPTTSRSETATWSPSPPPPTASTPSAPPQFSYPPPPPPRRYESGAPPQLAVPAPGPRKRTRPDDEWSSSTPLHPASPEVYSARPSSSSSSKRSRIDDFARPPPPSSYPSLSPAGPPGPTGPPAPPPPSQRKPGYEHPEQREPRHDPRHDPRHASGPPPSGPPSAGPPASAHPRTKAPLSPSDAVIMQWIKPLIEDDPRWEDYMKSTAKPQTVPEVLRQFHFVQSKLDMYRDMVTPANLVGAGRMPIEEKHVLSALNLDEARGHEITTILSLWALYGPSGEYMEDERAVQLGTAEYQPGMRLTGAEMKDFVMALADLDHKWMRDHPDHAANMRAGRMKNRKSRPRDRA